MPYSGRPGLRDPLVTQRNPFEIYLLVVVGVVATLSLLGVRVSDAVSSQSGLVVLLWGWSLLAGSILGLTGAALPLKHLGMGLQLERSGMIFMGAGVLVYAWVVIDSTGMGGIWAGSTNAAFGLACCTRVYQISRRYRWYHRFKHSNIGNHGPPSMVGAGPGGE